MNERLSLTLPARTASGSREPLPVVRGQDRFRSKVRAQAVADELVEQEQACGVFDLDAALEVEAAHEEQPATLLKIGDRAGIEPGRHEQLAFPNPSQAILLARPGIEVEQASGSGHGQFAGTVL